MGGEADAPADALSVRVTMGEGESGGGDLFGSARTMMHVDKFRKKLKSAVSARRLEYAAADEVTGLLSLGTKLAYGAPAMAITSITMLIGIHGTIFYTAIGANVAFIAFFIAIARSFDVITDPLMGWVSDNTKELFGITGRRRPFIALGCFGYALFMCLLFSPPSSITDGAAISVWFGVFYVCFYLFDTCTNVPWGAFGPELTDNPAERDTLFSVAGLFRGVGILIGACGPVGLTAAFTTCGEETCLESDCSTGQLDADGLTYTYGSLGDGAAVNSTLYDASWYSLQHCKEVSLFASDYPRLARFCTCLNKCAGQCDVAATRSAMITIAIFFSAWFILTQLVLVKSVPERAPPVLAEGVKEPAPAPLASSLLATMRNDPFMRLLPSWVLDMTSITMVGTMLPFYVEYVVAPGSVVECDPVRCETESDSQLLPGCRDATLCSTSTWIGIGLVALIGANILSLPLWLFATKTFGKFPTWIAFNVMNAVTTAFFFLVGRGDPILMVTLAFINGLPGGAQFLNDSIVADTIDYDELLTGDRSEGRFTIFQTFLPKLVSIPSQVIPLAMLNWVGYIAPVDGIHQTQTDDTVLFIQVVFFILPTMVSIVSCLIKLNFPITTQEQVIQIGEGCALHRKGELAPDPLDFMRLKGLMVYHSKLEEERARILDTFFKRQLEIILQEENGIHAVRSDIMHGIVQFAAISSIFFVTLVASVSAGFLDEPSWAWLPSFSVILMSMFACLAIFTYMRWLSAGRLLDIYEGRGDPEDGTWAEWEDLGRRYFVYLDGISPRRKVLNRHFTSSEGGAMEGAALEMAVEKRAVLEGA